MIDQYHENLSFLLWVEELQVRKDGLNKGRKKAFPHFSEKTNIYYMIRDQKQEI